jgi:hypothetical protein
MLRVRPDALEQAQATSTARAGCLGAGPQRSPRPTGAHSSPSDSPGRSGNLSLSLSLSLARARILRRRIPLVGAQGVRLRRTRMPVWPREDQCVIASFSDHVGRQCCTARFFLIPPILFTTDRGRSARCSTPADSDACHVRVHLSASRRYCSMLIVRLRRGPESLRPPARERGGESERERERESLSETTPTPYLT